MARAVNFIVSCTNRKRFQPTAETSIGEIGGTDLRARLARWKQNLRVAPTQEHHADEVYMGDHWSVVKSIPVDAAQAGFVVHIWICSAGYGLIRPDTIIKPYRATFTRGESDYIASGLAENEHAMQDWWSGVCTYRLTRKGKAPRTLSAVADAFPRTPMLVALSADYLKAVSGDLLSVLDQTYFRKHLSIVSCGTSQDSPKWKNNLLPCDSLMAGSLGGALTSLNARIARHLLQSNTNAEMTVDRLRESALSIERRLPADTEPGVAQTDSDVARFIRAYLKEYPAVSKSRLLREFRSQGLACEQKRFGEIFTKFQQVTLKGMHA
ncbi:MAG: hypothetical protein ABL967_19080 [Bryobacteraceae bacterium]